LDLVAGSQSRCLPLQEGGSYPLRRPACGGFSLERLHIEFFFFTKQRDKQAYQY
jgi:hypothetical protein